LRKGKSKEKKLLLTEILQAVYLSSWLASQVWSFDSPKLISWVMWYAFTPTLSSEREKPSEWRNTRRVFQ
jgi:hypothetical protein